MTEQYFNKILVDTYNLLLPSLIRIFQPLIPLLLGALAVTLIVWILRKIYLKIVFDFSILSGDSRREAKKRVKIANKYFELISWIHNIFGK